MSVVHLIHGFNEDHENQSPAIAMLAPLLEREGHRVMVHDYGQLHLLETTANDNLARLIYSSVRDGDVLVGFSNGAAIIAELEDMMVRVPNIVLIQPALRNDWVPNAYCNEVTVFWNPGDKATIAGKWYRRLVNLMPWNWGAGAHKWGAMGHTGYVGNDSRYTQFNTADHGVRGHSDWADPANVVLRMLMVHSV